MKKNTKNNTKNIFELKIVFFFVLVCVNSLYSQVVQQGTLHIKSDTYLYIGSGASTFTFGVSPVATTTDKKDHLNSGDPASGFLAFADGITLSGVADLGPAGHFVDGFVRTYSTSSFTFPIGDNLLYRPATVTSINNNNNIDGIEGAYTFSNPLTGIASVFTAPISSISSKEFWEINSSTASAVIELNWNVASDIASLSNSTSTYLNPYLTIVGWDGTKWVKIQSTIVGGDVNSGSIITDQPVLLSDYKAFTFGVVPPLADCINLPFALGTKEWDGTNWNPPGNPTITDDVTINAPYSNGSFVCNSLVLNADVTLGPLDNIEIVNGATSSTGNKIIMASSSSIVQRNSALPGPPIYLTLKTRSLRRDQYTYFGTPIAEDFRSQMNNAHSTLMPTVDRALDGMYKWKPGDSPSWQNLTSITEGVGFIAKITNKAPFYYTPPQLFPGDNPYNPAYYSYDNVLIPIIGTSNNGDVNVDVVKSTSIIVDYEGDYNLLANPYPSAIDADRFLEENDHIDGVLYIWRAGQEQFDGSATYGQSDFISYTKLGTTYTYPVGISSDVFNGDIASGQGFMVRALTPGTNTVTFNNCMRLVPATSNTSFNRTANKANSKVKETVKPQIDKFKLTLSNDSDVYSQILIGYLENCTNQYDRMYDANRNSVSTTQLFSLLDDGKHLAINARPTFSVTDVVPLGVTKVGGKLENYKISIGEKEGVFNGTSIKVYLYDNLLRVYHNFENGDYVFSTNSDELLDRFSVVYNDVSLSNPDFDKNRFITYIDNEVLYLNSLNEMSFVEVYDLAGRVIDSFKINENERQHSTRKFNHSEAVYIVKVKFVNGAVGEQKLINRTN